MDSRVSGYPCEKYPRYKQWPRQNLNHDEYGGYYFFPPSLYPMTTWARLGLKLPPICLQIILASCLRAGTQKFPEVRIKSLLSRLAFLVGVVFPAGFLYWKALAHTCGIFCRGIIPYILMKFANPVPGCVISGPVRERNQASDSISHWPLQTNLKQPTTIHCLDPNLEKYDILLGRK